MNKIYILICETVEDNGTLGPEMFACSGSFRLEKYLPGLANDKHHFYEIETDKINAFEILNATRSNNEICLYGTWNKKYTYSINIDAFEYKP